MPLLAYFFSFLVSSALVVELGVIVVFSSLGFWFSKNILGRELVGLKWGRIIHENGDEEFFFQSKKQRDYNAVDKSCFWGLLILSFLIWLVLFGFNLLSLSNFMVVCIPLVLGGINLYCFYKCSREQQKKLQQFVKDQKNRAALGIVNHYAQQQFGPAR